MPDYHAFIDEPPLDEESTQLFESFDVTPFEELSSLTLCELANRIGALDKLLDQFTRGAGFHFTWREAMVICREQIHDVLLNRSARWEREQSPNPFLDLTGRHEDYPPPPY